MSPDNKKTPLLLLGLFCLLPSIQTAVSVHWQWHTAITYPAFKILMIAIPIIVWLACGYTAQQIRQLAGLKKTNLLSGMAVGVLMSAVILAGYYVLLRPIINPAPILAKVDSLGLLKGYWIMALFISLLHSFFEEYYWRAFLLSELRNSIPRTVVLCLLSGVIFGFASLTQGIVVQLKLELGKNTRVIGTGGNIQLISPYCPVFQAQDINLTLKGLNLILKK